MTDRVGMHGRSVSPWPALVVMVLASAATRARGQEVHGPRPILYLQQQIAHLNQARPLPQTVGDPSPDQRLVQAAQQRIRELCRQLLVSGAAGEGPAADEAALVGVTLFSHLGSLDALVDEMPQRSGDIDATAWSEEQRKRYVAIRAALVSLLERAPVRFHGEVGAAWAESARVLGPLLDVLVEVEGQPAVSRWIPATGKELADQPATEADVDAARRRFLTGLAAYPGHRAVLTVLERIRAAVVLPQAAPAAARQLRVMRQVTELIIILRSHPDTLPLARDMILALLERDLDRLAAGDAVDQALAALERTASLEPAVRRIVQLREAAASTLGLEDLLGRVLRDSIQREAIRRDVARRMQMWLEEVVTLMRAYRNMPPPLDDPERRAYEWSWNRCVTAELQALAEARELAQDPARIDRAPATAARALLARRVEEHRRFHRLEAVTRLVQRLLNSGEAGALHAYVHQQLQMLTQLGDSVAAGVLEELDRQALRYGVMPGERWLRRQKQAGRSPAVLGDRLDALLAEVDRRRVQWAGGWARGMSASARMAVESLPDLLRCLRDLGALDHGDQPGLLNRWPAVEVDPLTMAELLSHAMGRLSGAVDLLLAGEDDQLRTALADLRRDYPDLLALGWLAGRMGEENQGPAAGSGTVVTRQGRRVAEVLGQIAWPVDPNAMLGDRQQLLAELNLYLNEWSVPEVRSAPARRRELRLHCRELGQALLERVDQMEPPPPL